MAGLSCCLDRSTVVERAADGSPLRVVGMDQAMPCGLLVNELISNALRHGFPPGQRGDLRLELHAVGDGRLWSLRVSDTGAGLPADFQDRRERSLGLQQLAELGYRPVGHAASGDEAVRLAGELRPSLVLMDSCLAGPMDGIDAAQASSRCPSAGCPASTWNTPAAR